MTMRCSLVAVPFTRALSAHRFSLVHLTGLVQDITLFIAYRIPVHSNFSGDNSSPPDQDLNSLYGRRSSSA